MRRFAAVMTVTATMTTAVTLGATTSATAEVDSPGIDPAALPPAGAPGPEQVMKQTSRCISPTTVGRPDVKLSAPGFEMLDIEQAWRFSTGAGVTVGVIDTGVTPNSRLPRLYAGGDYLTGQAGTGGLDDCDGHGTIVASIIGGQPFDPARKPPSLPRNAAPLPPPPPPPGQGHATTPLPKPVTGSVEKPAPAAASQRGAPPPPPARPSGDAFVGVAPDVAIIAMRQSSQAFAQQDGMGDPDGRIRKASDLSTLARAIRRMADLGAGVINVSAQICMNVSDTIDDAAVGAALNYAVVEKDAVVVAGAGSVNDEGCGQNPLFDPLRADDPRDWHQVSTAVTPAWYGGDDLVLTVGAVDAGPDSQGRVLPDSIAGPWVQVAAPGSPIVGLANQPSAAAVNAQPDPPKPGQAIPLRGTSYAASFVSGVAALVRARFPSLTAHQVMRRIIETAHNPAGGVDNQVGFGIVDPVLALTADIEAGPRLPVPHRRQRLARPAPAGAVDHTPRNVALICSGLVVLAGAATTTAANLRRRRKR